MDALDSVLALAATQHGLVTTADVVRAGLDPRVLVRTHRFTRLSRTVLRAPGALPTWEQALRAGLLRVGGDAWVARRAAAALYGFDGYPPGPVALVVRRGRRSRDRGVTLHTTTRLDPIDRSTVAGLPCTSATRTILDLAREATRAELERAVDSAVRDGWSAPAFLAGRLRALRGPGRWGVRLLDEVLVDSGGHSWLERRFLELVRRAGLPRPRCQVIHARDGHTVARVDFHFDGTPLVVEVSGRRGHATDADRRKDAHRRNELQTMGRIVLEFVTSDIVERPDTVIAAICRVLGVTPVSPVPRRATRCA